MGQISKPKILICATPIYGHLFPLHAVAKEVISRGYDVTFLTGSDYKDEIESIGAKFVSLAGYSDITTSRLAELIKQIQSEIPPATSDTICIRAFVNTIPSQHEGVQRSLKIMTDNDPDARIVVIFEGSFRGSLPTQLGAGAIKPLGHIGVGVAPVTLSSIDTRPWKEGYKADSSPEGRAINLKAHKDDLEKRFPKSQARWEEILRELGATVPDMSWRDVPYLLSDRYIQTCSPMMEYPRSDAPSTFRFCGGLGPGKREPMKSTPKWWDDIAVNAEKRKVIFVSQGTVALTPTDLIIPTMLAFKDRDDIFVVAALGKEGATLPEGTEVPENARIADFIPYDEILQYSDVFIGNGGYGSLQHSLSHGVPLIIGGESADKPENAMRVAWVGVGLDLGTARPTQEQLYEAVTEILGNSKYKKKAMEVKEEMASFDAVGVILENVEEVANAK